MFKWGIYDCFVIHLDPEILDCEVKRVLGSITMNKASGGDEIPAELYKILKYDVVNSSELIISANSENSAVATGLGKVGFHSNLKERQSQRMPKLPHNCSHPTR